MRLRGWMNNLLRRMNKEWRFKRDSWIMTPILRRAFAQVLQDVLQTSIPSTNPFSMCPCLFPCSPLSLTRCRSLPEKFRFIELLNNRVRHHHKHTPYVCACFSGRILTQSLTKNVLCVDAVMVNKRGVKIGFLNIFYVVYLSAWPHHCSFSVLIPTWGLLSWFNNKHT
jgi:hypothetical protein